MLRACVRVTRDFELQAFKHCSCCDRLRTFEVGLSAFCFMIWLQAYRRQGVECGGLNMTVLALLELVWSYWGKHVTGDGL